MNNVLTSFAILCGLACSLAMPVRAAEAPVEAKLDVLKMREIPTGVYDVALQLGGETCTVKLAVKADRAAFVESSTRKLEGLAGDFELIGNGVFLARLAGKNHRATQWWIFQPDGTATVKEIPDRGEKQTAKPAK